MGWGWEMVASLITSRTMKPRCSLVVASPGPHRRPMGDRGSDHRGFPKRNRSEQRQNSQWRRTTRSFKRLQMAKEMLFQLTGTISIRKLKIREVALNSLRATDDHTISFSGRVEAPVPSTPSTSRSNNDWYGAFCASSVEKRERDLRRRNANTHFQNTNTTNTNNKGKFQNQQELDQMTLRHPRKLVPHALHSWRAGWGSAVTANGSGYPYFINVFNWKYHRQ